MRTIQDFNRVLKDFTYKPGFNFFIRSTQQYGYNYHQLSIEVPSNYDSTETYNEETSQRKTRLLFNVVINEVTLSMLYNDKDIIEFIRQSLRSWELHEMDEWIKYNGEQIYNPHLRKLEVKYEKELR